MSLDHTYLLRLGGELCIKSTRTRNFFQRRLVRNVESALRSSGHRWKVNSRWSRLMVESDSADLAPTLRRIFGVQSVSRVERRPWTAMTDLLRYGEDLFRADVAGRTFAVRAKRTGDPRRIAFGSDQLERELGTVLSPYAEGVDLKNPEVTARVEVHPDGSAYFFTGSVAGYGGLPIGVEGRAISLASGGFDSAVASWEMLKRGVALDYVFFNLGGAVHLQGVLRVLEVLARDWSFGTKPLLATIDFRPVVEQIRERTEKSLWQVLLKRRMALAGSLLSRRFGDRPLVTGEAVGQVSSQTLANMTVVDQGSSATILRPLVTANKEEIVARAREIGTFELSAAVGEYCAILPRKPSTHARLAQVRTEEDHLDDALLARLVEERTLHHLTRLDPSDLANPHLEADGIDAESTLIDLRSRADYDRWHYPGALHLDFARATEAYPSFDGAQSYLLYCEVGLKSARLAELMQADGFTARHIAGGTRAIRKMTGNSEEVAAGAEAP